MYGRLDSQVFVFATDPQQARYRVWLPGRYNADVKLYANFTVGSGSQYVLTRMPSENLAYIFNEYNATPSESQIDFRTLFCCQSLLIIFRREWGTCWICRI